MESHSRGMVERVHHARVDGRPDQELREANQHMHEFLDLLGHELRSPLTAIRNALFIVELQGDDAAMRNAALKIMDRQVRFISRLVDDMRELSFIEHGKIHLHKQFLDLTDSLARAVEVVRASITECRHQLEAAFPPEPIYVDADPGRLEQMLTNLLNNAVKFMKPGGRVWVTVEVQNGDAVVRILDNGIGIASEMLPHIFDPFWQVERTFDHSQSGLGIGLALVRKLAQLHGGSVSALQRRAWTRK